MNLHLNDSIMQLTIKVAPSALVLVHLCKLRRLVGCNAGIDYLLNITVHNFVQLIEGQSDAVVSDTALREIVGTDLF